jgi:dienelactone hydrolase
VDAAWFAHDPSEPLGLWQREAAPPASASDLRAIAFEYSSRGDRVCARLWLPPRGDGPFPVVWLQHGAGGAKDAPYMVAVGAPWARGGAAVASLDFPLHGERANPKFQALVRAGLGLEPGGGALAAEVLRDFHRQAVLDLRRGCDALERLPGVDAKRIAYAGLSLGAFVGAIFCAVDPRPVAAALALGGAGRGGWHADPALHVGRIAPRPVLFVNATRDSVVPREAAQALHAAAGEPSEVQWFDAGHDDLPGLALRAMWRFLRRPLGLESHAR